MKLLHKGIILVMVPVAFEFVFVGSLFYMLQQAERERVHVQQIHESIVHLNNIQRLLGIGGAGLPVRENGVIVVGPHRQEITDRRVRDEFQLLREAAKNEPEIRLQADELQKQLNESMVITADIKNVFDLIAKKKTLSAQRRKEGVLGPFLRQMNQMWDLIEKIEAESPMKQAEDRAKMKVLLLVGLAANVGIALGLAFYFNRNTASRLAAVTNNATLFAEGKPLGKPLTGNDEIAQLDKNFFAMASELKNLANKEKALLANAADVICSLDKSGTITDVSPACEKVWGYSPEELLSMPIYNFLNAESVDSIRNQFVSAQTASDESKFESLFIRKDKTVVDMLWSVKWSDEEKTLFCVAHDNSERKAAERMKQEFVAMLSHDLRSPLNSVQAFFSMISHKVYGSLSDRGMAKAAGLEKTVEWLIELISDLLDIDKIEAGLADLDLKTVSLKNIVLKADEALDTLAVQNQVVTEIAEADAEVRVDEAMFLRVVTNLLSNAIKFAPPHTDVEIEIEKLDQCVELRVIDHGKGISPENQAAIFEKFRQVRDGAGNSAANSVVPNKTKASGAKTRSSGLGLAVSRAIVEQHSGTIGVRSVEGEGSTFWVRLPSPETSGVETNGQ